MVSDRDRAVLRTLAERYRDLCASDTNRQRIALWRTLNNGEPCRPLVFSNCNLLWGEIGPHLPGSRVESEALRAVERWFHQRLWEQTLGDDQVFYPWYTVRADMFTHPEGTWGVAMDKVRDKTSRGWRCMPVLRKREDLARLKATEHRVIDAHPPLARMLEDLFGDLLPVHIDRSSIYPIWGGTDLSEAPGALFGLEELLIALYEDPDMVHGFMAFTRDAVLANLLQGEAAGDWSTVESSNYLTPAYCRDLPDPQANSHGTRLKDLCFFTHAQEFEAVSPGQFEEFLLGYQVPIMALFGKVNYGCCETLDTRLHVLRRIPNLNKIAAGPLSNPALYPELFGGDCIISWRPLASIISWPSFDEEMQRRQLREGLEKLRGCQVELHMHEPMTVQNDIARISTWARIAVQEAKRAAP